MAMVEMMFVLPVLLLLVFAIAQFGLMFNRWLTLSNAVREGARQGIAFQRPCVAGTVEADVRQTVSDYAKAGGVGADIDPDDVIVTGACGVRGTLLSVDTTFQFPLQIPFAEFSWGPSIPLRYVSTMRNE